MATIKYLDPEWWVANTINVTTFRYKGKTYTISTVRLSAVADPVMRRYSRFLTELGDTMTGNTALTDKDYETMLFIDGESTGDAVYPFGDLPGNKKQGTYVRYDTEDQARDGHQEFVSQVKHILTGE